MAECDAPRAPARPPGGRGRAGARRGPAATRRSSTSSARRRPSRRALRLALQVYEQGSFLAGGKFFFVDAFNIYLAVLTAFVSMTTAIFSRRYMRREREHGRVGHYGMRFYHAMFQLFIFAMLLCLLTNNVGVLWIAMELATLSTVLLVSLYRTPTAIEAAWKYFILCGVGIAQALFGTVLLYFAAERVLGEGGEALLWTNLSRVSGQLEPTVLSLAFVFLMVGYGTKVGLVPLHNWLPDAHSEGPTPISAVLSGLLLNIALYALVRCKVLVDGATGTHHAGEHHDGLRPPLDPGRRVLAAAPEGHQADVLLLLDRAHGDRDVRLRPRRPDRHLRRAAAHAGAQPRQVLDLLHGRATPRRCTAPRRWRASAACSRGNPLVGWGFMLGVMAIVGMPPFGVFTSEFLILTATIKDAPALAPFLLLGLAVAFAALHPARAADGLRRAAPVAAARCGRRTSRCSCTWSSCSRSACTCRRSSTSGSAPRWGC